MRAGIAIGIIVVPALSGIAADTTLAQSLSIARIKWLEYAARLDSFHGTLTETITRTNNSAPVLKAITQVKRSANGALFTRDFNFRGRQKHEAGLANSEYSATMSRASIDKPWILTGFTSAHKTHSYQGDAWDWSRSMLQAPLTVITPREVLPELSPERGFVVTDIVDTLVSGETLSRVTFKGTPKQLAAELVDGRNLHSGRMSLITGHITLDPRRYWVIRSFEVIHSPGGEHNVTANGVYEYRDQGDLPIITRSTRRYTGQNGEGSLQIMEFDLTAEAIPDSQLSLSAFGLPEPPSTRVSQRSYSHLWAIGIALGCFVGALAVRRLSKLHGKIAA